MERGRVLDSHLYHRKRERKNCADRKKGYMKTHWVQSGCHLHWNVLLKHSWGKTLVDICVTLTSLRLESCPLPGEVNPPACTDTKKTQLWVSVRGLMGADEDASCLFTPASFLTYYSSNSSLPYMATDSPQAWKHTSQQTLLGVVSSW